MDEIGLIKNRKAVPRWREVERASSFEISSAFKYQPHVNHTDDLLKFYYNKWRESYTVEDALDVLFVAQAAQNKSLAFGPAEQILKIDNLLPETKKLAETIRLIRRTPDNKGIVVPGKLALIRQINIQKIKDAKSRLINEPRNGLLWLELSRLQASLGNTSSAKKAMRNALANASNNRIVLRAAARFLIHLNEFDEAHFRLRKSEAVGYDPWIQSAEIAVAALSGKIPLSLKAGKSLIAEDRFEPIHISELSVSIGTEELKNGNVRIAKKFFKAGMIHPTENSVAQAFWAKQHIDLNLNNDKLFSVPNAFEARANEAFRKGNFEEVLENCLRWCNDEPFSTIPAVQGVFVASAILNDHRQAVDIFEFGQLANPNDYLLLNNGTVSLAKLGRIQEAQFAFNKIEDRAQGANPDPTIVATKGLIQFRLGEIQDGRKLYEESISLAHKAKNHDLAFRAASHWLIEELEAKAVSKQEANKLISTLDLQSEDKKKKISVLSKRIWEVFRKQAVEISSKTDPEINSDLTSPQLFSCLQD
jgi:tetratricopeptide (TPR) repeat protein